MVLNLLHRSQASIQHWKLVLLWQLHAFEDDTHFVYPWVLSYFEAHLDKTKGAYVHTSPVYHTYSRSEQDSNENIAMHHVP